MNQTKAVVSIIGKDHTGIMAAASQAAATANANILEVTQSILDGYFVMIMILDITESTQNIDELRATMREALPDMQVHLMHEDIFNSMHRI